MYYNRLAVRSRILKSSSLNPPLLRPLHIVSICLSACSRCIRDNFIANALSAIAAYCFFDEKPVIDVDFINDRQLGPVLTYIELTLNNPRELH